MSKFVISFFPLLVAALCFAQESKRSPEQEQVWNMEEKYWQIFKARDGEGYIALWDENFVGWPNSLQSPIGKNVIRANPFGLLEDRVLKSVQLEPKSIQLFKDVAITYYVAVIEYSRKDGSIGTEALCFSHIWHRTNGAWLIIGGMSAPAQESK